jgi:predicted nucleotidyltransferase
MAFNLETVRKIASKYANDVRSVLPVKKVILYGSYAKGTATESSDVDICFFVENLKNNNRLEIMRQLLKISSEYLEVDIEPRVFHISVLEEDNPFVKEIVRTGIEID